VNGALARLRRSPLGRAALLAAGGALLVTLAASPSALGPAAARAGLVAAALGGALLVLRRAGRPAAGPRLLAVLARETLGREAGVALVEVGGRRLLLGFGPGGVQLVAEAGAESRAPGREGP